MNAKRGSQKEVRKPSSCFSRENRHPSRLQTAPKEPLQRRIRTPGPGTYRSHINKVLLNCVVDLFNMVPWVVLYLPHKSESFRKKKSKGTKAISIYIMAPYRKTMPESSHDSVELYNLQGAFIQIKLIQ